MPKLQKGAKKALRGIKSREISLLSWCQIKLSLEHISWRPSGMCVLFGGLASYIIKNYIFEALKQNKLLNKLLKRLEAEISSSQSPKIQLLE